MVNLEISPKNANLICKALADRSNAFAKQTQDLITSIQTQVKEQMPETPNPEREKEVE